MEQHPVPQNVTGFQFKLIGDITLKQFAYLAGGIILGYIALKIDLVPSLIRWPFAAFWVIFGFGLAFVPIEERPLDRMVMAFIKNIYSPTQFVWRKQNLPPEVLMESTIVQPVAPVPVAPPRPKVPPKQPTVVPVSAPVTGQKYATAPGNANVAHNKVQSIPPTTRTISVPPQVAIPIRPPAAPAQTVNWWQQGAPQPLKMSPSTPPISASVPSPSITGKRVVFQEKNVEEPKSTPHEVTKQVEKVKSDYQQIEQKLKTQMETMQKELEQGTIAKERFLELQQVLTQLLNEKERLSQELIKTKKDLLEMTKSTTVKPTQYSTVPQDSKTTVKMVPPAQGVRMGMPTLTALPNVITGIIKESNGNLLPNLIVTVKDKDGIPVRALKTNKLGQFAASTPLTNGVYIIEVEDPKQNFQFNRIEVGLSSQVLPPLEIFAISEKDIMRAKLTRELFGKNNI